MFRSKWSALVLVGVLLTAGGAFAQTTQTTVQKVEVEVVYVHGNTVVFLENGKAEQREVPADFRINVDGKMVSVSELQPGQKVMIERTTDITTFPPAKVVTVRNGEVLRVSGRTLLYREDGKNKSLTVPSDFKFMVDGRGVGPEELRPGMKLTATIVTEKGQAPKATTKVAASGTAPKAKAEPAPVAAAPAPAPPPAEPAPAPAPEPVKVAKKLPGTASSLPLVGLAGGALLALGAGLTLRRRLF